MVNGRRAVPYHAGWPGRPGAPSGSGASGRAVELPRPGHPPGWFDLAVTQARDAGGRVTGAVLTLVDVTAERRLAPWEQMAESLMNL